MPNTRPSRSDDNTGEALDAVHGLLAKKDLRLSTDDRANKRFDALMRVAYRSIDKVERPTVFVVARSEQQVGILMMTGKGLPFCYMTNGFVAAFDPNEPGHMLLFTGGQPSLEVGVDKTRERVNFDISFRTDAESARLVLDFRALLESAAAKARGGTYDKKDRTIQLETDHATTFTTLSPADEHAPFPLATLIVSTRDGDSVAFGPIGDGTKPSAKVIGVTQEAISKLGIPIRAATKEETARFQFLAPDEFAKDSREAAAAKKFLKLFVNTVD